MAGFGAVPDELRETAGMIGDAVAGVAGMVWRGPSGDYGHPGVQAGWEQYVNHLRRQVEALRDKAEDFGVRLGEAAGRYLDSETEAGGTLGTFGDVLENDGGALRAVGGGISDVLNGDDAGTSAVAGVGEGPVR